MRQSTATETRQTIDVLCLRIPKSLQRGTLKLLAGRQSRSSLGLQPEDDEHNDTSGLLFNADTLSEHMSSNKSEKTANVR